MGSLVAFVSISSLMIAGLCVSWLRKFARPDISLVFTASVFISWATCLLMLIFLPVDLAVTAQARCQQQFHQQQGQQQAHCDIANTSFSTHTLNTVWTTLYWTAFNLGWIVIPIEQSYSISCHFSITRRLLGSIRENILVYSLCGVALGVLLVWIKTAYNYDSSASVTAVLMCLNNIFGLLFVTSLMSYGLIEVPKMLWRQANRQNRMKYLTFRSCHVYDRREDSRMELATVVHEVSLLEKASANLENLRLKQYCGLLRKKIPEDTEIFSSLAIHDEIPPIREVTYKRLVAVNSKLQKKLIAQHRWECLWDELMTELFLIDDINEAVASSEWRLKPSLRLKQPSRIKRFLLYVWFVHLRPFIFRIGSIVAVCFTLIVLCAQSTLLLEPTKHGRFLPSLVHKERVRTNNSLIFQFFLFAPLLYVTFCVFYTIFEMRIFSIYQIFNFRQTDAASLLMNAYLILRFAPGLCLNFMLLLHETSINSDQPEPPTSFSNLVARIDLGPLPQLSLGFTLAAPVVLFVLVGLFALDVPKRLIAVLGITRFESQAAYDSSLLEEGKALLEREKSGFQRRMLYRRSTHNGSIQELELSTPRTDSELGAPCSSRAEDSRILLPSQHPSIRERYADRFEPPRFIAKAHTKAHPPAHVNLRLDAEFKPA